jgi:hypothetical protein
MVGVGAGTLTPKKNFLKKAILVDQRESNILKFHQIYKNTNI